MERTPNTQAQGARRQTTGATSSPADLIKKVLGLVFRNWYWFVISLAVFGAGAWFYVKSKEPVYLRSASIMIKQSGDGMDRTLKELGVPQASTNLVNEILLMNSSVVAEEVVRRLHLDVNYYEEGPFYDRTIYGIQLPVNVFFLDLNDNDRVSLTASLQSDSTVVLSRFSGQPADLGLSLIAHNGDTLQSPLGRIVLQFTPSWTPERRNQYTIVRNNLYSATEFVRWHINASLRDRNSSIIDIRYRDVSLNRADDILNTLVTVYNEQWMNERNKQIISTNDFIRDRLSHYR